MTKFSKKFIFIILILFLMFSGLYIFLKYNLEYQNDNSSLLSSANKDNSFISDSYTPLPIVSLTYLRKKDNKFNLYKLQKQESNLYSYNNITFKKTENGLLYNTSNNDDFTVICNFQEELHNDYNHNSEMHSKYEDYKEVLWDYEQEKTGGTANSHEMPHVFFPYKPAFVCRYEGYDYFELTIIHGGGSGEFWGGSNSGIYVGINSKTMEAKDFGDFRAGYCKEKNNWVYYIDLINVHQERAKDFPEIKEVDIIGIGYLCRMRPDGSDKKLLSDKVVEGMFYLQDSKIYFKSHEDKKLHIISEDGQKEFEYKNEIDVSGIDYYNIEFFGDFCIIEDWSRDCYNIYFINDDGVEEVVVENKSNYSYREVIGWDKNSLVYFAYCDQELEDDILYLFTNINFD